MKLAKNVRRAILASCLTATTLGATGCSGSGSSITSLNPFNRSAANGGAASQAQPPASIAANKPDGSTPAVTASSKPKSFFGKTTDAITGVFRRDKPESEVIVPDENDPLSLANKPEKVSPDIFAANGRLWESSGDFVKAMESYNRALNEDPKHATALTSLARLHYRQGNMEEAEKYFRQAVVQKPQDAAILNDLGLTLGKLGNRPAAIESLQKALAISPGTSRYANNLASIQFEEGDTDAALASLMKNNKPAVAHFNMAYLYYKAGKSQQAKGHLNEALKYEPQAGSDAAIGRAVQRSRDMLAQLGTPGQAIPATTFPQTPGIPGAAPPTGGVERIASAPSYTAPVPQSISPTTPTIRTVSSIQSAASQAVSSITPPPAAPSTPIPATQPDVTPLPPPSAPPVWNSWNGNLTGHVSGPRQSVIRPKAPSATADSPSTNSAQPPTKTPPPSGSEFVLPGGFKLPSTP